MVPHWLVSIIFVWNSPLELLMAFIFIDYLNGNYYHNKLITIIGLRAPSSIIIYNFSVLMKGPSLSAPLLSCHCLN